MAILIISRALLVVLQHVVGFVQFLEFLLCRRIIGVAIRMVLHGELAERLFQFVRIRGAARHAENVVVIAFGRHFSPHSKPGPVEAKPARSETGRLCWAPGASVISELTSSA